LRCDFGGPAHVISVKNKTKNINKVKGLKGATVQR
jgi:hypothetical protein